ncbi:unnamed protein product [Parnassius apollo]|uniref:(apollo) hypothetical protein n=1 Tax=Parnassius apollo TaxID=110799 RepID=A0A8S3W145_PARAO|nr:unnamed protein product [Parnassius apollo]
MDVDDSAVDLSVRSLPPELSELRALTASGLTITPAQPPPHGASGKRVLRPRSEQRSYAESPDIVLLPAAPPHRKPNLPAPAPFTDVSSKLNAGVNVSITPSTLSVPAPDSPREPREDEESEEDENEPPLPIAGHRELSSAEIWERERRLRALREKLRAEETRLVLLRKLRQSQQTSGIPPAKDSTTGTALAGSGCVVPPGVTVTPAPPPAHQQNKRAGATGTTGNNLSSSARRPSSLPGGATLTPGPYRSQSSSSGGASITPSVTITPAPPPAATQHAQPKASSRSSDDTQTPAQRQAAAKLALRKQLEKTLLQIPPPKPPPPEMNFIPSPSNTDFVYLVGLEHVVDYLTNEERMPRASVPAVCAQCGCDFTAVWRWERAPPRRQDATFSCAPAARRLCELCVSGNVKRALKVCAHCAPRAARAARAHAVRLRLHGGVALGARAAAPPGGHLQLRARRAPPLRAVRLRQREARAQGTCTLRPTSCSCPRSAAATSRRCGAGSAHRQDATFSCAPAARRLCALCVSGNVKRALTVRAHCAPRAARARAVRLRLHGGVALGARAAAPPGCHLQLRARRAPPLSQISKLIFNAIILTNFRPHWRCAEHTARLKTAFVRALQQEQEIERRLAAPAPSPPPAPPPAHAAPALAHAPAHAPHAPHTPHTPHTPHQTHAHRAAQMSVSRSSTRTPAPSTPTAVTPQPTTTKPPQSSNSNRSLTAAESLTRSHHSERAREPEVPAKKGSSSSTASQGSSSSKQHQQLAAAAAAQMAFEQHSAAAMQALQHQLLRGLSGAGGSGGMSAAAAAAMMQFSPLLYTYQLAMAQASALGKRSGKSGNSGSTAAMAAEMQRVAEAQRQYLLDMIPGQHGRNPWTKN